MSAARDPRRHAFRPDLADSALKGKVQAERFVVGAPQRCAAPLAPLRSAPDATRAATATLLRGEGVTAFETRGAWAWVQSRRDGYVGYAPAAALGSLEPSAAPTHRVAAPRVHLYPAPDFKTPPLGWAPLGGLLALGAAREGRFAALASTERAGGESGAAWVVADHLTPIGAPEPDFVAVAERFEHAPYLWGGESVEGIDCSGLVQVALEQTGRRCPRDSDMQERELGQALAPETPLRRGDLVFWRGHVGVMLDAQIMLHANAGAMLCAREPLVAAIARIEAAGEGPPTSIKRLA